MEYKIMPLDKLRQHEEVNKKHLAKLSYEIRSNRWIAPILVDSNTNVILDGHHRYNAMKVLGFEKIPVFLVKYDNPDIKVDSWRDEIKVTKQEVVERGLSGNPYPPKTSRHTISWTNKPQVPLEAVQ